jgi:hypothetical protein
MALNLPAAVRGAFVQKFRQADESPAGGYSTVIATEMELEICRRRQPVAAR